MTKDEALVLALEALENSVDLVCEDAYNAEQLYGNYPTRQGKVRGLKVLAEAHEEAISAIKEALAQPEQPNTRPYYTIDELNAWAEEKEKQAWRNAAIRIGEELSSVGPDGYYEMDAWKWLDWAMEQEPRGKNSLAQPAPVRDTEAHYKAVVEGVQKLFNDKRTQPAPVQEPMHPDIKKLYEDYFDKCFRDSSSPQRTWVGLTEEDLKLLSAEWRIVYGAWMDDFARDIEAKLKEKNNG